MNPALENADSVDEPGRDERKESASESETDWEEVDLPTPAPDNDPPAKEAIGLTLTLSRPAGRPRRLPPAELAALRQIVWDTRQCSLTAAFAVGSRANAWSASPLARAQCLSLIPLELHEPSLATARQFEASFERSSAWIADRLARLRESLLLHFSESTAGLSAFLEAIADSPDPPGAFLAELGAAERYEDPAPPTPTRSRARRRPPSPAVAQAQHRRSVYDRWTAVLEHAPIGTAHTAQWAAQAAAAALRALGFDVRLVASLKPARAGVPAASSVSSVGAALEALARHARRHAYPCRFWLEVWDASVGAWAPLDAGINGPDMLWRQPTRMDWDEPTKASGARAFDGRPLSFAVSFDGAGKCLDVTARYSQAWHATEMRHRRTTAAFLGGWTRLLDARRPPRVARELAQLAAAAAATAAIPTTRAGLRNHPLYVLESDLRADEAIHPADTAPAGLLRGAERIFHRACVHQVLSKDAWLRKYGLVPAATAAPARITRARLVTDRRKAEVAARVGELQDADLFASLSRSGPSEPLLATSDDDLFGVCVPQIKKTHTPRDVRLGVAAGSLVALFGRWQTVPYDPPSLGPDGTVPLSSDPTAAARHHLDVFHPNMVPRGTVHLREMPRVAGVVRSLGLSYASAVTGFEFSRGRAVPTINGVIVAAENAELVREAYAAVVSKQSSDEVVRRRRLLRRRWQKWTRFLERGAALRAKYLSEEDAVSPAPRCAAGSSSGKRPLVEIDLPAAKQSRGSDCPSGGNGSEALGGGFLVP